MSSLDDLDQTMSQLTAVSELLREKCRALRIARALPADHPPFDSDEVRAQAAALRAENDLAEARAILAATQRH